MLKNAERKTAPKGGKRPVNKSVSLKPVAKKKVASKKPNCNMTRLNESLINDLEADIRRGLKDIELQKKHNIPESTWRRWKTKGVIDRSAELQTVYTLLLDILREGREEFTKQIENVLVKAALGQWRHVTTTKFKNSAGETIKTVEKITTKPDVNVANFLLSYLDPERWGEHKKTEPPHPVAIVTYPVKDDPWLKQHGNQNTNRTQSKEAEKQPEQPKQPKQPKRVVKPIEWAVIKMALGMGKRVSTKKWKVKGKIIGTVERTTTRKPSLKAAKRWLSHRDPERWSKYKQNKPFRSIATIIPDSGRLTEKEWSDKYKYLGLVRIYGNNPTQPEQKEKNEVE